MPEQRLERMEGMLSQLVTQVGTIMENQTMMQQEQKEMKGNIKSLQDGQAEVRKNIKSLQDGQTEMRKDIHAQQNDLKEMQKLSDHRYRKVMDQLHLIRFDQDHTWEKVVQNERKIAILEGTVNR